MPENQEKPGNGMSDLVKFVGDDNLQFQVVEKDMVSANMTKKGAQITIAIPPDFVQDHALGREHRDRLFLLWMPRERVNEFLERSKD